MAARAQASKEVTQELLRLVVEDIADMWHTWFIITPGIEPATKASAGRVRDMRSYPTITEESPDYEPQAGGVVG